MGGTGSGNSYRWNKQTTIEETKRIDIRYMKKQGLLKPGFGGSLKWSCGGRPNGDIRYSCYRDRLQLNFRYREHGCDWQPAEQIIYFDRTPCNYGGERLWFLCPRCERRVGILCGHGVLFLCRHCCRLPYASQQESYMGNLIIQQHKLGRRIFEHYEYGEGWGKKKGMHWTTYERLYKDYMRLDQIWYDHMISCL